ncbi:MAG: SOS response-associated peptidase [Firmicutes bacterium]|nr:SOS response-associated peptidase [Bacillota bacterium]
MCGRFALVTERRLLELLFEIEFYDELESRYNIAPSEMILALRQPPPGGQREMVRMKWGLLPFWAVDKGGGKVLINARAETVADKPAFRSAFQRRRALIPASGFYEWLREEKSRKPFYIHLAGGGPFALGALYESLDRERKEPERCAIITTAANSIIAPIHHRMPLIIPEKHYSLWLNGGTPLAVLQNMLKPYPADKMAAYPVSRRVNSPAFDHPDCLKEEI